MTRRAWTIILAGGVLLVVAVVTWQVVRVLEVASIPAEQEKMSIAVRRPSDSEEFVGSGVCSECHAAIAKAYDSNPMAHSTEVTLTASLREDYEKKTSFETGHGLQFRVERSPNGVTHHEFSRAGNDVLYDRSVDVHWTIGSGKRGRSYAFESEGMLFQSPISWYSQRGIWDMSPGFAAEMPSRFDRRLLDGCIACHVGRANSQPGVPDRFEHPAILEAAIGCERCHGPGARHVQWRRSTEPNEGSDPIVNPGKLPIVERESVCNQCHLQGVRSVLRFGCTPYDFRPGQRLDETWTVFVEDPRTKGGESAAPAVSQVEQMRTSRCYQKTSAKLGCVSCHDPHGTVEEQERTAYYERRCQACHETQGCSLPIEKRNTSPKGSSCIECHMPRLMASDIPHTSQTDHRVLRDPKPAPKTRTAPKNSGLLIFDEDSTRVPESDRLRARALIQLEALKQTREPETAEECRQQFRKVLGKFANDPEVLLGLGTASLLLNDSVVAETYFLKALAVSPDDEKLVEQLALFYDWKNNQSQARRFLEKSLAQNSANVENWGRYAQILGDLGDWPAAFEAAEKGLKIDPAFMPLRNWTTNAYRRHNDDANAERHRLILEQLIKNQRGTAPARKSRE